MTFLNKKFGIRLLLFVIMGIVAASALLNSYHLGRAGSAQALSQNMRVQVLDVACPNSRSDITGDYARIADVGKFTVQSAESVVEVTYNGRLWVASMTGTTGVIYELRVDDIASPVGRARAVVRSNEVGGSGGVPASITGIFTSLAEGEHTLSIWARAASDGSATSVLINPGCFSVDHAVIKEFLPFGTVALPLIINE